MTGCLRKEVRREEEVRMRSRDRELADKARLRSWKAKVGLKCRRNGNGKKGAGTTNHATRSIAEGREAEREERGSTPTRPRINLLSCGGSTETVRPFLAVISHPRSINRPSVTWMLAMARTFAVVWDVGDGGF